MWPFKRVYCRSCGTVDIPDTHTPGSPVLEVFLWLVFIVPGLVYSSWRSSSKRKVCHRCRSADVVPLDTPVARAAIRACPVCGTARDGDADRCRSCNESFV